MAAAEPLWLTSLASRKVSCSRTSPRSPAAEEARRARRHGWPTCSGRRCGSRWAPAAPLSSRWSTTPPPSIPAAASRCVTRFTSSRVSHPPSFPSQIVLFLDGRDL
ncbi:hypothetical protein ZWY2020_054173 [Hordeum vulgare]|nr:hypothetical protein ZWY2020_054173 [Hordeum vulgare]